MWTGIEIHDRSGVATRIGADALLANKNHRQLFKSEIPDGSEPARRTLIPDIFPVRLAMSMRLRQREERFR
jgi:hypothetical protein